MLEFIQPYLGIVYAVVAILVAIVLFFVLLRLLGGSVRGKKGQRLGISEYYEIDKSRRLVLLRRDAVEHLVLIGGEQDIVIETAIGAHDVAEDAPAAPQPVRPAPRPAVFGGRRPALRPVDPGHRTYREEPEM